MPIDFNKQPEDFIVLFDYETREMFYDPKGHEVEDKDKAQPEDKKGINWLKEIALILGTSALLLNSLALIICIAQNYYILNKILNNKNT